MKVTVVGTGNVGSALLFPLAYNNAVEKVGVISRKRESADAAIMDVASAFPKGAAKMVFETNSDVHDSDVIVITSGVTPKGRTVGEIYGPNFSIAEDVIKATKLKSSVVLICLATPVDDITADMQRISKLPAGQVIGFGGDLDSNRLRCVLNARNLPCDEAEAIGEHGPNSVPVYRGEKDYEEITHELHQFWPRLIKHVDVVRNLATADLLGQLVASIVADSKKVHNVCVYHPQYQICLTWPTVIGKAGAEQLTDVTLGMASYAALERLVASRKDRNVVTSAN